MKDTQTIKQFFSLLRSGLWQLPADTTVFEDVPTDWDRLMTLSTEQTVPALVYSAITSLPAPFLPDKNWFRSVYSAVLRTEQAHILLNRSLLEAVSSLQKAGIRPVLLKGQAYARHYIHPFSRNCGDIDLYIGEQDFSRACALAEHLGWKASADNTISLEYKHHTFYLHGVPIELHREAANFPDSRINQAFRRWSQLQLYNSREYMFLQGQEIPVPDAIFEVIFVFLHLYIHFLHGGIGLRQFCDWAVLLHTYHRKIDTEALECLLRHFKLLHGWQLLGCILVDRLGLPEEEFPFYALGFKSKSEKALAFILEEGNFGTQSKGRFTSSRNYWRKKLHTYGWYQKRILRILSVFPHDAALTYRHYIYTSIRKIFNERLCRRK